MKLNIIILSVAFISNFINANGQYKFTDEIKIPCSKVENQKWTGTCWSFSSTSFLESEITRINGINVNLSEMYNVRMAYPDKALNYVLRQGKANFSEGGLAHDVMRTVKLYGIIPQNVYSGIAHINDSLDHRELHAALKSFLDAVIKTRKPGRHWNEAVGKILDTYMGPVPSTFTFNNKEYNPITFMNDMGIVPDNYISITSFNHHPFDEYFILEIPDNHMNGSYLNVKIDELIKIIDNALENGYTLTWDGDVSEKGFDENVGIAILPKNEKDDSMFVKPVKEVYVNQENRQENFMNYSTTDDHLMQIIGSAKDQNNKSYYIIKNSWGKEGPYKGYLYISKAYLKMKTISITVHKDALPKEILKKM
ncbi:C1 family peptidase [Bacteroidota bacterium]